LIQHVYEQASRADCADRVIIAADDPRTVDAARSFAAEVVMTDPSLASGTDRVAAVAEKLGESDLIINVQGDEPEIHPQCIDQLAELLTGSDAPMATLATYFGPDDDPRDTNMNKVVCDKAGYAIYFSRNLIPYPRDGLDNLPRGFKFLLHLGIYAYRREFLLKLTRLDPSPIEQIERLEQLRVLWYGYKIKVGVTDHRCSGVDTPQEYKAFVDRYLQSRSKED